MRKQARLTQLELSQILDKPRTYVTKYENADRNLDFIEVIKICHACKVAPSTFIRNFIKQAKLSQCLK